MSFQKFEPASKTQLKKIQKTFVRDSYKSESKKEEKVGDAQALAQKVVIEEDKSLLAAKRIKINASKANRGVRVKIFGWVHRMRRQGE